MKSFERVCPSEFIKRVYQSLSKPSIQFRRNGRSAKGKKRRANNKAKPTTQTWVQVRQTVDGEHFLTEEAAKTNQDK